MTTSKLGTDIQTGQLIELPQASRRQGLYIIGANGTGKTGLIENLVVQDINQGLGVGVLDPHGDLTNAILAKMTKRLDEVILLDIAEYNYPFGLNIFTCSDPTNLKLVSEAESKVRHVFKKLWGKGGIVVEDAWGVLLEEILRNATMTLLECSQYEAYTMAEIPLLLEDAGFRNHLVQKLTFRHVQNYWLNKYNRLSDKDQLEERRSTLNRINAFLTQPLVEHIVGQAKTTIDFRRIMDERKILLVMLDRRMEDVTSLIGSMIIAEFLDAAYSRANLPIDKRKQFNLYADEFQLFATEDFATLLTEARKFGIATTIAHQIRDQLDTQNRAATLNVANLVIFKISGQDAQELAPEFNATPPEATETKREAVLVPKQDVLTHLIQNGHSNEWVTEFVTEYLPKLYLASEEQLVHDRHSEQAFNLPPQWPRVEFTNSGTYAFEPQAIKKSLSTLNRFLYHWSTIKRDGTVQQPWTLKQEVLKGFADLLGYSHYYLAHYEPRTSEGKKARKRQLEIEETQDALAEKAFSLNTKEAEKEWLSYPNKIHDELVALTEILDLECKQLIAETLQRIHAWDGLVYSIVHDNWFSIEDHNRFYYPYRFSEADIPQHAQYIFVDERKRFYDFEGKLQAAAYNLTFEPIMAESCKYEEKPLAPRTYADVQNEIASNLANLPRFTAKVKIASDTQTVEHTVKTLSPDQGIGRTALEQRKATIKAQNIQLGYYRPRKDVEEEITNRQQHFAKPQPYHARQVPVQGNCPNCHSSKNPSGARFCMQCGTKL